MGINTGNGHDNEHIVNTNKSNDSLLHVFGDDDLIKKVFPGNNIKIIFSEDFMKKSKDFYAALPWLGRELIQNFIDANPHDRGTLNGVDIHFNKGDSENNIKIRGNWVFEKPTALYKLDSGKADDENMAGGNGIGLKQTVLILFRDYGIKDFIIRGKNRSLRYNFLSASDINGRLEKQGIREKVSKGWLVAEITPEAERDFTEYEIVVNHKKDQIFDGLQHMKQYGVYDGNPYLQNMEYTFGSAASFKLLPDKDAMGALFLNGQRFRCKLDRNQSIKKEVGEKYKSQPFSAEELYRGGPSGLTLCINTKYKMSIDRQPLGSDEVKHYTEWFLENMELEDIIDLFVKIAPTWKALITKSGTIDNYTYYAWSEDTPLMEHFIYQIVGALQSSLGVVNDFDSIFENTIGKRETFVACDIKDPVELRKLSKKGYTLVPEYFKSLGIQGASLLATHTRRVLSAEDIQRLHEEQAMETGVSVPYREFEKKGLKNEKLFYGYLSNDLGKSIISYSNEAKKISIEFTRILSRNLDTKHLYGIKPPSIIQDIRGLYMIGEEKKFFDSFVMYLGNYRVDFQSEEGELLVKISIIEKSYDNLTLEIGSENFSPDTVQAWTKKLSRSTQVLKKGLISPYAKRLSTIMILCGLLFGAGSVVKNFGEISKSIATGEDIHRRGIFSDTPHYVYDERKIEDFVRKYNQANIPVTSDKYQQTQREIYRSLENVSSHEIEDFELVTKISSNDMKKLQLLKTYMEVALHIKVDNLLFLFEGKGTKGVNMGTTKIGLHTSMMDVSFFEALKTFVHEVAHNNEMNHGNKFIHTNSALHTAILERYTRLTHDMAQGKTDLNEEELFLLQASHYWDSLAKNNKSKTQ